MSRNKKVKDVDKYYILRRQRIIYSLTNIDSNGYTFEEIQEKLENYLTELKDDIGYSKFEIETQITDTSKVKWNKGEHFVKLFKNEILNLKDSLSNSELSFLYLLSNYLSFEENLIIDSDGQLMNIQMMCKEFNMSKRKIIDVTNSLYQKLLLFKIKNGKNTYLLMNPYIMHFGSNINLDIAKMFINAGFVPYNVWCVRYTRIKTSKIYWFYWIQNW